MRCSGHFANLQNSSFIEMSLKLVSDVVVGIEIFLLRDQGVIGDGN